MKFCLIGEHLSHSYSAEMHGRCGLDYVLKEVPRGKLADFLKEGYDGFNVTIPYKLEIMPLLDGIDDGAKEIGAVNTVVKKDGKYYGYNTDIEGMRYSIARKGVSLNGKSVMILGSGGTSNTAKALCRQEKAKSVTVVSRSGDINYETCYRLKDTEIIINATPVGMFPNVGASPVDLSKFPNLKGVFDCIYNPFNTALIEQAKSLKIPCSDGVPMLVMQALAAYKIWGVNADEFDAEQMIDELYRDKLNVVLCGMPSSGKTTIGKLVAEVLCKKFIDTDAEILRVTGKTPSEIIEQDGEKAFRDIESEIISSVAYKTGLCIATGGGAILRKENVRALKANGVVFYIQRDLALLSDKNRPVSQLYGIERLYNDRKNFYEMAADITVENDGEKQACADMIAHKFRQLKYNPKG